MAHHYSGPDFGFPRGDVRLDLSDVFAFPKPGDIGKSILIMTVHPSSSSNPSAPTMAEPFSPEALYELKIDTNGDAIADIAYRVRFSSAQGGKQTATLRRVDGTQAAGTDDDGQVLLESVPVSTGQEAQIAESRDHRFFAGWRSDPFFFDVTHAKNLDFTGDDFFADKDVCGIVLELPNSALGGGKVGLWARTLERAGGTWIQADRGARPGQSVFLVSGAEKDAYLTGSPADDARFVAYFAHALEYSGGYKSEEATRMAKTLLPDLLPYDPKRPAAFPDNGRSLTDDVVDFFLTVITNGKVTKDNVGPHRDLLTQFPYMGPPHKTDR